MHEAHQARALRQQAGAHARAWACACRGHAHVCLPWAHMPSLGAHAVWGHARLAWARACLAWGSALGRGHVPCCVRGLVWASTLRKQSWACASALCAYACSKHTCSLGAHALGLGTCVPSLWVHTWAWAIALLSAWAGLAEHSMHTILGVCAPSHACSLSRAHGASGACSLGSTCTWGRPLGAHAYLCCHGSAALGTCS